MAKIIVEGNVGRVETGTAGESLFFSFTVAERFAYFDDKKQDWVEKGTQWHRCIVWIRKDNQAKFERLKKFIVVGAGVLVSGRTTINPSEELDENGKSKYLNEHINVDDVALTTERLLDVSYKPKSTMTNIANDPEQMQQNQQAQQAQQATPFDVPNNGEEPNF